MLVLKRIKSKTETKRRTEIGIETVKLKDPEDQGGNTGTEMVGQKCFEYQCFCRFTSYTVNTKLASNYKVFIFHIENYSLVKFVMFDI